LDLALPSRKSLLTPARRRPPPAALMRAASMPIKKFNSSATVFRSAFQADTPTFDGPEQTAEEVPVFVIRVDKSLVS